MLIVSPADNVVKMFTDFLAECRAMKLHLGSETNDVMGAKEEMPLLAREKPQRVAVAA